MKSNVTGMLISFSVLTASALMAAAQQPQPSPNTIVVGSGNDLRCRLEKGLRITKAGEPITAKLVEPVYVGTALAIPEGSTIKGHRTCLFCLYSCLEQTYGTSSERGFNASPDC